MSASHFGEPIGRPTLSAFHDGCRAGLHDAGCQAERGEGGAPWPLHIRIEAARQLGVIARVTVIAGTTTRASLAMPQRPAGDDICQLGIVSPDFRFDFNRLLFSTNQEVRTKTI
jgi:hypothetical protein